jgi:hypothetical protein
MHNENEALRKKIDVKEQNLVDKEKEISEFRAKTREYEDLASK